MRENHFYLLLRGRIHSEGQLATLESNISRQLLHLFICVSTVCFLSLYEKVIEYISVEYVELNVQIYECN